MTVVYLRVCVCFPQGLAKSLLQLNVVSLLTKHDVLCANMHALSPSFFLPPFLPSFLSSVLTLPPPFFPALFGFLPACVHACMSDLCTARHALNSGSSCITRREELKCLYEEQHHEIFGTSSTPGREEGERAHGTRRALSCKMTRKQ